MCKILIVLKPTGHHYVKWTLRGVISREGSHNQPFFNACMLERHVEANQAQVAFKVENSIKILFPTTLFTTWKYPIAILKSSLVTASFFSVSQRTRKAFNCTISKDQERVCGVTMRLFTKRSLNHISQVCMRNSLHMAVRF